MAKNIYNVSEVLEHPQFLKFVEHYTTVFKTTGCLGRWIKEYQDMEDKGQFAPKVIKALYINILRGTSHLDFQRRQVVWFIGRYAEDAAKAYVDEKANSLYEIRVITGELAYDDDDDPYTDLTYEEATQIVKALNEEAEEELFTMKRK